MCNMCGHDNMDHDEVGCTIARCRCMQPYRQPEVEDGCCHYGWENDE